MTKLAYLHEPGVLHNLAVRYDLDEIYVRKCMAASESQQVLQSADSVVLQLMITCFSNLMVAIEHHKGGSCKL